MCWWLTVGTTKEAEARDVLVAAGMHVERVVRDGLIDSVRAAGASDEETLQIVAAGLIASPAFQWR